jgi:diguanylate cyclase (GGDEF)-like protein
VVVDGLTTNFGGNPSYLARRYVAGGRWSLIIATSTTELFATRVLGIIITLLTAVTTLIYLFSRDRQMRNVVEMKRRLKLQELAQNMRAKATTDALTGLNNRLKFDETFAVEIARTRADGTPLALALFDLDHFKRINDTYGHQAGDKTLVKLSLLASAATRASDVLARWGGDEFVILLPDTDGHTAREVAERLRTAVRDAAFEHGDVATCTFGVAQYVAGESVEAFIARADAALYRAKSSGRDRVEMAADGDEAKSLLA